MPIDFVCPSCFRPYSAPEDVAGKAMSCAGCSGSFNIPSVKIPALPPEPGSEPELLEAELLEPAPPAPLTPQLAPPLPPPKVVVWQQPAAEEPDEDDEDDCEDDEDEEYAALLARKQRREDRERAKFWFWVKLSLIVVCLVGICVGLRIGLDRVDAVREHNKQIKSKPPR